MASKIKKSKHPIYPTVLTNFEIKWNPAPDGCIAQFESLLTRYLIEVQALAQEMSDSSKISKGTKPYIIGLNELIRCLEKNLLQFVIITNGIPEVIKFHIDNLLTKYEVIFGVLDSLDCLVSLFHVKRLSCFGIKRNQLDFGIRAETLEGMQEIFEKLNTSKPNIEVSKGKKKRTQEFPIYKHSKMKFK